MLRRDWLSELYCGSQDWGTDRAGKGAGGRGAAESESL